MSRPPRLGRGMLPPNDGASSSSPFPSYRTARFSTKSPVVLGEEEIKPLADDPRADFDARDYGYGESRKTENDGTTMICRPLVNRVDVPRRAEVPLPDVRPPRQSTGGFAQAMDMEREMHRTIGEATVDPIAALFIDDEMETWGGFGTAAAAPVESYDMANGAKSSQALMGGVSSAHRALWAKQGEVVHDVYVEHEEVKAMADEEVVRIRRDMNVEVYDQSDKNRRVPKPCLTFAHAFKDHPEIISAIDKMGFERPTTIQQQMWPIVLSGHDCIGIAQTGKGKTIAFLLPAFIHMYKQTKPMDERLGPSVLVVAPVRELAQQIHVEVQKYPYRDVKSVCIYGGRQSVVEQTALLRERVNVMIATPGRLIDMLNKGIINLSSVTYLVLDEADRMLTDGFQDAMRTIVSCVRPDRQMVMTSATWPEDERHPVRQLAASFMTDAFLVHFGLDLTACSDVTQRFRDVSAQAMKTPIAKKYVADCLAVGGKCIVFVNTKVDVVTLAKVLQNEFSREVVGYMTGDLPQVVREHTLAEFKSGRISVLVATEVVARGIDVKDVTHVLNYDFPGNSEQYVHRVGRTGRGGKKGDALTIISMSTDMPQMATIVRLMTDAGCEVPHAYKNAVAANERRSERRMDRRADDTQSFEYRTNRCEAQVYVGSGNATMAQIYERNMPLFTQRRLMKESGDGLGGGGRGGGRGRGRGRGFM